VSIGRFKNREASRRRRTLRVRRKVQGTAERPRLSIFRSNKQIYVQAVDDVTGVTLAASSSVAQALKGSLSGAKASVAGEVGKDIGKRLIEAGVKTVVFDRGWYHYHGRVKALAEGAREAGLEF